MVKRLISVAIIILFLAEVVIFKWPADAVQTAHTIALVILAAAAGVAIGGHIGGGKRGKTKN